MLLDFLDFEEINKLQTPRTDAWAPRYGTL